VHFNLKSQSTSFVDATKHKIDLVFLGWVFLFLSRYLAVCVGFVSSFGFFASRWLVA
jgi:hypothetical protein